MKSGGQRPLAVRDCLDRVITSQTFSKSRRATDLLRSELGVAPEAATCALIDAIKRGDFEPVPASDREQPAARSVVEPVGSLDPAPAPLPAPSVA